MHTSRIFYELVIQVESLQAGSLVNDLQYQKRINVMTPEFCEPIWNQQLVVKQNIRRLKVFGQGACIMTCVLEKDILYPRDSINLQVYLDNTKCKRKIEKYTIRFVKRVQFFEKNKVVFLNDEIFHEKVVKAKCEKN